MYGCNVSRHYQNFQQLLGSQTPNQFQGYRRKNTTKGRHTLLTAERLCRLWQTRIFARRSRTSVSVMSTSAVQRQRQTERGWCVVIWCHLDIHLQYLCFLTDMLLFSDQAQTWSSFTSARIQKFVSTRIQSEAEPQGWKFDDRRVRRTSLAGVHGPSSLPQQSYWYSYYYM